MTVLKDINFKVSNSWIDAGQLTYPVGSVYSSRDSTSPASLFGGTWEQIKNRFLVGAGDTYSVKKTGGEATHTLTVKEMPSHQHGARLRYADNTGSNIGHTSYWGNYGSSTFSTDVAGGGQHTTICRPITQSICGSERPSKCGDVVCHHLSISWMLFIQLAHTTSLKATHHLLHFLEERGANLKANISRPLPLWQLVQKADQQATTMIMGHLLRLSEQLRVRLLRLGISREGLSDRLRDLPMSSLLRALWGIEVRNTITTPRFMDTLLRQIQNRLTEWSTCGTAQPKTMIGGAC